MRSISLTFQSAGVATFFVAVNCRESTTRKISLKIEQNETSLIARNKRTAAFTK